MSDPDRPSADRPAAPPTPEPGTTDPPRPAEETSMASLVDRLTERGYRCPLVVKADGIIHCPQHDQSGPTSELTVDAARRFEGMSDPGDMCLVAAVRWSAKELPDCRGVLVLTFGPMAPPEHQAALAGLSYDRRRANQFV